MAVITKISNCRSCTSAIESVFDLGSQPFANSLLPSADAPEDSYPLHLGCCINCGLVQLLHTANPELLFSHYVWVTGTSSTARGYAGRFCAEALTRLPGSHVERYVLEVASNDGTFLKPFTARGISVLGVDPAENLVAEANAAGIRTRCGFFGKTEAGLIASEYGSPSLVIARNVLPHVADPLDFVAGIADLIGDDGIAAIEFHDGRDILRSLHYDSIYHEHLCYFTVTTIGRLLATVGLQVVELDRSPISGGSLIAYIRKRGAEVSPQVTARFSAEHYSGINTISNWRQFGTFARQHAAKLRDLIQVEIQKGRQVVGYGASARSSTLLNFARIDWRDITAIADQNPLKQGLFTAGTHIPVRSPQDVFARKPDTVFLLAWNFRDEIASVLRDQLQFRGSMIVPLPGDPVIEAIN